MRVLESFSRFLNCLIGGNEFESISARSHREGWKVARVLNFLFFWQNNHCRGAYNNGIKKMKVYLKGHGHE